MSHSYTKKKTKQKKETFSASQIVDHIIDLRSNYSMIDNYGSRQILNYKEQTSKLPFEKIIYMIQNCDDLEKSYVDPDDGTITKMYVFPLFYTYLKTALKFFDNNSTKDQKDDIDKYKLLYIKVVIEIIREYLENKKYIYNNEKFYSTVEKICENHPIKDKIMSVLEKSNDDLLNNPNFVSLCDHKISTEAYHTGLPLAKRIKYNTRSQEHHPPINATYRKTKPPVIAEEEPDYYDNPISWNPRDADRLRKRPRSLGGKRRTKRRTKRT
jgi:hypothetical protein